MGFAVPASALQSFDMHGISPSSLTTSDFVCGVGNCWILFTLIGSVYSHSELRA